MRWWDIPAAQQLEQALFDDPWSGEQFLAELAHVPETRWYTVLTDDDGLLAYAGLRAVDGDADVQTIGVAPRAQGRGLGGRLLDDLLAQAVIRGCGQAFLEVRADNEAALALYGSRGFRRTGVRPGYYGRGLDAIVMRRDTEPW
jgi:ribosomal-protein-alanine N-acetyltransferase